MPKVKLPRSSPSIDMTPMVDLAFLLVTFFMLTTKFRPEEPVKVVIPASVSDIKIPENLITLSIDTSGRVFFDMDNKDVRPKVLQAMGVKYKQTFDENDLARFAVMGTFGVPINELKQYIEANDEERKEMSQKSGGIPMDTLHNDNELADWSQTGYSYALADYNEKKSAKQEVKYPYFAIKADANVKYKVIKKIVDMCQNLGISHFEMITSLKSKPTQ